MHFLAQGPALIGIHEIVVRGDNDAEQFQYPQESQESEKAQVQRNAQKLQIEGRDCQQVDDGKGAEQVAAAGVAFAGEIRVFRRDVKAQEILQRENHHGEDIEIVEPMGIGFKNGRHLFEQQREQIDHDQNTDPLVDKFLVIPLDMGIHRPGIQPFAQRQIARDIGLYIGRADDGLGIQFMD